ncbi:fungal-specific transcription factor domain-containing protein [Trichoderma ceciliae]
MTEFDPEAEAESESKFGPVAANVDLNHNAEPRSVPGLAEGLKQRIIQYQQIQLQQTPGYVQGSAHIVSDLAVDQDHDYASYYDFGYDADSDNTAMAGKRSHTPYILDSLSRTSTVYQVKCTWAGSGAPPLASRLSDYFNYMNECHISPSVALPVSLLPACEYGSSEILRYYGLRSANCSAKSLSDINPTNPKLFELAYSNPLVLQLILAQRANHREVSSAVLPTGESADRFYATAISEFGPKIASYLAGNEEDMLPLTLGSIVLSLTEMARLDKCGQAHNHSTAAKAILTNLLTFPFDDICKDLPDFLVEYYMYTASFACLSANAARAESVPFMSQTLRDMADDMYVEQYQGKLCGSWLEMLITIQDIFELGMAMRRETADPSSGYSPNHFVDFGTIQARLFSFKPTGLRGSVSTEAAILFRNAAMLYLWTLLESPHVPKPQGSYSKVMRGALYDAVRALKAIPDDSSVNKALCWPMLIVGCCTADEGIKLLISVRLHYTARLYNVGNPLETHSLLQHIWKLPSQERSPWMVWKYIQDSKFAGCTCPKCLKFF